VQNRRETFAVLGVAIAGRAGEALKGFLMRLLVVADLHYSLPQYDWVTSVASDFDVVIIAGDHLDLSSAVDASAQIFVIGK